MSVSEINAIDVVWSSEDEGYQNYAVEYEIITTDVNDNARTVMLALVAAYPPGTPYQLGNDSFPWCWARRPKSIKRRDIRKNRKVWRGTIDYSNKPLKSCQDQEWEHPLDKPPVIGGSFVRAMRAATKDRHGNQLANSVAEPWIPSPEVDDSRDTITIQVNTATINLLLRSQARDKVNDADIWGLPARSLKLSQWKYTVQAYGLCEQYVANDFEFEVNVDRWNEIRLDQGFRKKLGIDANGNTTYETLMDEKDQPLREPRLLDGNGNLLADGADPVEIEKEVIDEFDFSQLPLPNPLPIPT